MGAFIVFPTSSQLQQLVAPTILAGGETSISIAINNFKYRDLLLRLSLRCSFAAVGANVGVKLNNDTTSGNYHAYNKQLGTSSVSTSVLTVSANGVEAGLCVGNTAPADYYTNIDMYIRNYSNVNIYKEVQTMLLQNRADTAANDIVQIHDYYYKSLSQISSIVLTPSDASSTFMIDSMYSAYGVYKL